MQVENLEMQQAQPPRVQQDQAAVALAVERQTMFTANLLTELPTEAAVRAVKDRPKQAARPVAQALSVFATPTLFLWQHQQQDRQQLLM